MTLKYHQVYKNEEGKRVPGVSTIKNNLGWNTNVLVNWAVEETKKGNDYTKVRDKAGSSGTLVHQMIPDYMLGIPTDTTEYSKVIIDTAENSFLSFLDWEKDIEIDKEGWLIEVPQVSEIFQFGGTPDLYCRLRRKGEKEWKWTLLDWKSGKDIYAESLVQVVGGYTLLLEEQDKPIDQVILLNIPKGEDDKFREIVINNVDVINNMNVIHTCKNLFVDLLTIHNYHKILNKVLKGV